MYLSGFAFWRFPLCGLAEIRSEWWWVMNVRQREINPAENVWEWGKGKDQGSFFLTFSASFVLFPLFLCSNFLRSFLPSLTPHHPLLSHSSRLPPSLPPSSTPGVCVCSFLGLAFCLLSFSTFYRGHSLQPLSIHQKKKKQHWTYHDQDHFSSFSTRSPFSLFFSSFFTCSHTSSSTLTFARFVLAADHSLFFILPQRIPSSPLPPRNNLLLTKTLKATNTQTTHSHTYLPTPPLALVYSHSHSVRPGSSSSSPSLE